MEENVVNTEVSSETSNEPQGVGSQSKNQPTNNVPGAAPGETKAETLKRMYKVTVDGSEMEVDEDELRRGYSHNKAAEKKMQEAGMTRKEAEKVLSIFRDNPREAFKLLGKDARAFAESVIQDDLDEAMLSKDQKELRDYKRQLEQYQLSEKSAREEYEREQTETEMARYTEHIQQEIVGTLETAGLPRTERTVGRIAYYMQAALQAGYNDVTPKDVIEYVRNDYVTDFKSFMGGMSEQQIEMFLGADTMRKVAKSTLSSGMKERVVPKSVNTNIQPRDKDKKVVSPREYFKRK